MTIKFSLAILFLVIFCQISGNLNDVSKSNELKITFQNLEIDHSICCVIVRQKKN